MALEPQLAASAADEDIITTGELDDAAVRVQAEASSSSARKGKRRAEDDEGDEEMAEDDDVERPQFKKLKGNDGWVSYYIRVLVVFRAILTTYTLFSRRLEKPISDALPFRPIE